MVKRKVKKVKLKKKNFVIFITILALLIALISKTVDTVYNLITQPKEEKTETKKVKKEKTKERDKRLEQLDNIDLKISYFNHNYIDRYIKYRKNNPDLKIEDVILRVNIGIDNEYYTNTKPATNLNKNTVLVNKYNYLNEDYEPKDLEKISLSYSRSGMKLISEAKDQFEAMAKQAEKEGLKLIVTSSYRGYDYQETLYNNYVKRDGKKAADTYSGRPGFSEHQTGLAVDLYDGETIYTEFEKTKEFKWMQENAHKYGFILRFPKDKEDLTGYEYESWHYRYVGQKIATYIHDNNLCYEEYYAMFVEVF